ncbi:MAG: signal peptidase II [Ignavibacteria bacterium]|nr:signal peptidase II [Ignavibacteria bacterium]
MRVLILTIVIVISDQLSKIVVKGFSIPALGISVEGMHYGVSRPILGDFLRLTYIENPGMAFGIDIGGKLFFSLFSMVASIAILAYLYRARREPLGLRFSLAMILGGAVGNLIDRTFYGVFYGDAPLFYGKVVDFIDVDFFDVTIFGYHLSRWPVFNVADASVTIGVLLLLIFHRSTVADQASELPVRSDPDIPVVPLDRQGDTSPSP